MYKKHKIIFYIVSSMIFAASFILKMDYSLIVEESITIVSIVLAIYMTSFSNLVSSELAEKMKKTEDIYVKGKSQLGVLRIYLNRAVVVGLINICIGCITLLIKEKINDYFNFIISAIGIMTLSQNIMLMYWLYKFMVNRQLWSK